MGVDTNIHVGAYIELKTKSYEEEVITGRYCSKCELDYTSKENIKYCPNCGELLLITKESEFEYYDYYDLIEDNEEFEDVLLDTDCMGINENSEIILLIGNLNQDEDNLYELDISEDPIEIPLNASQTFIENFKDKYKDILKFLENHEKIESIKIKFGAFVWYN